MILEILFYPAPVINIQDGAGANYIIAGRTFSANNTLDQK
jgi:hypothetical protein